MKYFDVIIIGAGPSGLSLALSLSALQLSVLVVERQPLSQIADPEEDGRDIALTHSSRQILDNIGVWKYIQDKDISIIKEARVFNENISYSMNFTPKISENLAFIVPNYQIRNAVYKAAKDNENISIIYNTKVMDIKLESSYAELDIGNNDKIRAKLIAAADSRFSETRKKIGIAASMHDFGKTMVVCRMSHELPHNNVASECFLNKCTIAALPLQGKRSSIIITVPPIQASNIMNWPVLVFNSWVENQLNNLLGKMTIDSKFYTYPLTAVFATKFVTHRGVLIGDSAVGMHPVTAHGFNFGLKGQHTLSSIIKNAMDKGNDIGSLNTLSEYERVHKAATKPLYAATNFIVGLYTNNSFSAQIARKVLLRAADQMWPLKQLIVKKLLDK